MVAVKSVARAGPHRLDGDWTKISAFLHDELKAQEKSDEPQKNLELETKQRKALDSYLDKHRVSIAEA